MLRIEGKIYWICVEIWLLFLLKPCLWVKISSEYIGFRLIIEFAGFGLVCTRGVNTSRAHFQNGSGICVEPTIARIRKSE